MRSTNKEFRKKLTRVGLVAGLIGGLIGAVLSYFLFPKIITEYNDVVRQSTIVDVDTVYIEKEKVVYRRIEVDKTPKKKVAAVDDNNVAIMDTVALSDGDTDVVVKIDSALVIADPDTSVKMTDTLPSNSQVVVSTGGGSIHVAKNEMVYSQYIIPSGDPSNYYCNTDFELDSLLVGNYTKQNKEGIYVEFWASPLNTTGYQLSKNKLILFGFYEYKNIDLKYLPSGKLQMKYFDNSYSLTCGGEFTPLVIHKRVD